ncbi:LuxR C-terminal-related transcriptional regulator [Myroides sp. DW712]|uniref:LuxR C-terminal-related transcriptional regulator n=1 Tax=Myroides sp. DW712 TaxID=3389800 RepID=UPI00397D193F
MAQHSTNETEEALNDATVKAIQAFARMTYKSIYVLNHEKKEFDYIADNPLFLCGHTVQKVRTMGFNFYAHCVPEEEQGLIRQLTQAGFSFFNALPMEYKKDYTLSCDFHLKHPHIPNLLIRQEVTPLQLTSRGRLSKSICMVSLSTARQAGNITVYTSNPTHCWMYDLMQKNWRRQVNPTFTTKELTVLYATIQGFTVKEIADLLYLAPDTIKFHRKKIMEKCHVHTLTEAIRYVIVHKLL